MAEVKKRRHKRSDQIFQSNPGQSVQLDMKAIRNDILATYAEPKVRYIAGLIGGALYLLIPLVFLLIYCGSVLAIEKIMRSPDYRIEEVMRQNGVMLSSFLKTAWPFMIMSTAMGALLAKLRELTGLNRKSRVFMRNCKNRWGVRIGFDTVAAIVLTPVLIWTISFILGRSKSFVYGGTPYLLSGLALYVVWNVVHTLLLRKYGVINRKQELEWSLREMFRRDLMFDQSELEPAANVEEGVIELTGYVDTYDTREAARQIALNQLGVKRVVMDDVVIKEDEEEGE